MLTAYRHGAAAHLMRFHHGGRGVVNQPRWTDRISDEANGLVSDVSYKKWRGWRGASIIAGTHRGRVGNLLRSTCW